MQVFLKSLEAQGECAALDFAGAQQVIDGDPVDPGAKSAPALEG